MINQNSNPCAEEYLTTRDNNKNKKFFVNLLVVKCKTKRATFLKKKKKNTQ